MAYRKFPEKVVHNGLEKELVNENTYLFTTLRDPIARAVSHYAHEVCLVNGVMKKIENIDTSLLTYKKMIHHFNAHKNFGKFMTISLFEDGKDTIDAIVKSSEDYYKSPEEIDAQLAKFHKIIKLETFTPEKFTELRAELHNFLQTQDKSEIIGGLNEVSFYDTSAKGIDLSIYTNKYSKQLYESLTPEQLNTLKQYFELDYYVYSKTNF